MSVSSHNRRAPGRNSTLASASAALVGGRHAPCCFDARRIGENGRENTDINRRGLADTLPRLGAQALVERALPSMFAAARGRRGTILVHGEDTVHGA